MDEFQRFNRTVETHRARGLSRRLGPGRLRLSPSRNTAPPTRGDPAVRSKPTPLPGHVLRRAPRWRAPDLRTPLSRRGLPVVCIARGAIFMTVALTGANELPWGARLLAGLAFSLGLILVIVGGAELFTGDSLMQAAGGELPFRPREPHAI